MKKLLTICFITLTATVFANTTKTDFKNTSTPGFLENKGQIADDKGNLRSDILFTTQSQGVKVFIGKQGLHYQFSKVDNPEALEAMQKQMEDPTMELPEIKQTVYRLDVELIGANPNPTVLKENATGYFENYYLAHCPDGITGVKSYEKVILKDVYQGIDWVFYRKGDYMKYDFVVHPGADASQIKLQFKGAENLQLNEDGSFTVKTPLGTITEEAPISFTQKDKQKVESSFVLNDNVLSFNVTNIPNQTLVIDPTLQWATYYGGSGFDRSTFCVNDIFNNVYISGFSASFNSISSGGHQMTHGGGAYDAFLVKFNNNGVRQWATYYGGLGDDVSYSCNIDFKGNIYIVGYSNSTSDISFLGFQDSLGGSRDVFLVKFNNNGIRLWATYYGGLGDEIGFSCASDLKGNIYFAGYGGSSSSIASGGFQNTYGGGTDAFLVKLDSSGNRVWATYYGGTSEERTTSCAIDSNNNVYLAGMTKSTSSISFNGHQNIYGGGSYDAFLVKFDELGNRKWATYYGGAQGDIGRSCIVDSKGNVYLAGNSSSTSNISFGGFQNNLGGGQDAFLTKFDSLGNRKWATYYGGTGSEIMSHSISFDLFDNLYFSGSTSSTNAMAYNGYQNIYGGGAFDAYLVKFDTVGNRIWATYYGGSDDDRGYSCAVNGNNNVYLAGETTSTSSISFGGHQSTYGGGAKDAFLAKFAGSLCTETTNALNPTTCVTYTVPSGDETYTNSGTYMDTIPNVGGCDSVLTINLTINNSTTGTDVISACGSHTWIDGNFYTTNNNTATHTLTNSVGCDSVVTLNLTILLLSGNTINVSACDTYTVPSGDETYTVSGNYLDTLVNSMGCDSALLINLTVINSTSGSENITACDNYTWSANTTTYTTSGSYVATLTNSVGCDSTATLNLTINNSTSGSENITACDSYIWSANTTTYTTSGSYTTTLTNSVGCDSIATLNLTINNSNSGSENATACDSYTWSANGTNYTASGNYTATLTNVNGCDSIATLNLTIETTENIVSQTGITLTASATGFPYQWVNCDIGNADINGETNQSFTPTVNGNYAVQIAYTNCVVTSPCTNINSVGIESLEELGVKIYPNPSSGQFTIDVQTNCKVEIVNAIGEIVFKQNLVSGANAVDISTNPNGLYFIKFKTKDAVFSKRIVLSK